jgi:hypothetical protein
MDGTAVGFGFADQPAYDCPRSLHRLPPTRAGIPDDTLTACRMSFTSASAASCRPHRDGRRLPNGTRRAGTMPRQCARPPKCSSPGGFCCRNMSTPSWIRRSPTTAGPTPLGWSRRTADRNLPRVHRRSEEPDDSGQPYFHVKDVVPIVVGVHENDRGKTQSARYRLPSSAGPLRTRIPNCRWQ